MKMRKVEVYRNLHKKCWSIRDKKTKKVIGWKDQVLVLRPKLVVKQGGRARVLREKRKNVHAWVEGILLADAPFWDPGYQTSVTYDPYLHEHFVERGSCFPVYEGNLALLDRLGRLTVWVDKG